MLREQHVKSVTDIPDGRLRALYEYWNAKRGERPAGHRPGGYSRTAGIRQSV